MNWTLEQLHAFVVAAEQGSFSGAARTLGRAQSVISTHVSTLEAELGLELFDRSKRLPVLTESGCNLLAEAREVLHRCQRFDARAHAEFQGESGTLGVSVGDSIPPHIFSNAMAQFSRKFPHIRTRIIRSPHMEAWRRVDSGDVQIAILYKGNNMDTQHCESTWVATVPQVVVTSADHPLASKESVSPADLALHRQIIVGDSNGNSLSQVMSTQHWETNDLMDALNLACQGVGWTIIPEALLWVFDQQPKALEVLLSQNPVMLRGDWQLPPASIVLLWNFHYKRRDIVEWLRLAFMKEFETSIRLISLS